MFYPEYQAFWGGGREREGESKALLPFHPPPHGGLMLRLAMFSLLKAFR